MSKSGLSAGARDRSGAFVKRVALSSWERVNELRYGIRTYSFRSTEELGLPSDSHPYSPVPYGCVRAMLREVPRDLRSGTLIDFGSGLGRALAVASTRFQNVIGVELSEDLVSAARVNLAGRKNCQIHHGDAAAFPIPRDASVFFLANPFFGEVMRRVVRNIADSLHQNPRPHLFLVYNRAAFEEGAQEGGVELRRLKWVRLKGESWASYQLNDVQGSIVPTGSL